MTSVPQVSLRPFAPALFLGPALLVGCTVVDPPVGTLRDAIYSPAPPNLISLKGPSLNSSVAVSDSPNGRDGLPIDSLAVVAYERAGLLNLSWSTLESSIGNTMTWQKLASTSLPTPSGEMSDGNPFYNYEGWPTALAPNQSHLPQNTKDTFVVVSKAGSIIHGTSTPFPEKSTDVVALVSDDRPVSFHSPRLISAGPLHPGAAYTGVDYPAATFEAGTTGHQNDRFRTVWRQDELAADGSWIATEWLMRATVVSGSPLGPQGRYLDPESANYILPLPIPRDAGPVSIAHHTSYTYVAYANYDEPSLPNPCPSSATVASVEWRLLTVIQPSLISVPSFTDELIVSADDWKRCVGASAAPGGTPYNRHPIRPAIAVDRATGQVNVVVTHKGASPSGYTRVHLYSRAGGGAAGSSAWTATDLSPVGPIPGTPVQLLGDDWSPSIAVNHYPGSGQESLAVTWRSARVDPSASKVSHVGTMSVNGGPWDFMTQLDNGPSTGAPVYNPLGHYNSLAHTPHIVKGYVGSWTFGGPPPPFGSSQIYGGLVFD